MTTAVVLPQGAPSNIDVIAYTLDRARQLLRDLGQTPEAITTTLCRQHIKVPRGMNFRGHPLVAYLRRMGLASVIMFVWERGLYLWPVDGMPAWRVDLPVPLLFWLDRWRDGKYEQLVFDVRKIEQN